MATTYDTASTNWLNSDLLSQTQKNAADLDLSSQLAKLLRDRGSFQQQNDNSVAQIDRAAPGQYEDVAQSFAARGLQSSTPYLQADDRAFENVQTQKNTLATGLSEYMNNYDAAGSEARMKAEQKKREIEATALQRYAQQKIAGIAG